MLEVLPTLPITVRVEVVEQHTMGGGTWNAAPKPTRSRFKRGMTMIQEFVDDNTLKIPRRRKADITKRSHVLHATVREHSICASSASVAAGSFKASLRAAWSEISRHTCLANRVKCNATDSGAYPNLRLSRSLFASGLIAWRSAGRVPGSWRRLPKHIYRLLPLTILTLQQVAEGRR